ncbi:MAG: translation elongation factor G [Gemmatimonadetes bacterium GWC2_71_9]|nr:MAG: translation elongation factor G [Gemmatimonadetes bacterium GWC2_71_9]OGT97026.1 MAG: translation elongation factor G [Gemmatimonadetes bacterium RIFCSPLOWO2_02_FULL_71_11]
MKEYASTHIRNVAVVGHGGSGKTSLVDALAFVAGSSKRHGRVKDGTALTDYSTDEIEKGYSISLALAFAEWEDVKINLIDTPGFLDFAGDTEAGIFAADAALIVLGATSGVEVGTEKVWEYSRQFCHPAIFYASMMDKEHGDFERIYQDIREHLTPKAVPVEIPIGEGPKFHGIINLITRKAHLYKHGTKTGEYEERPIPAEQQADYERYEKDLIEKVVETDDALMERYLAEEEIGHDELVRAMRAAMKRGELFPILCGAAELTYGMRALLSEIVELVPPPSDNDPVAAEKWGSADKVELASGDDAPFAALVFKVISEPHVGDVSVFRIYSGSVKNGAEVWNAARSGPEKLNHLSIAQGKEKIEVPILHAGDIGVIAKLRETHTNDSLSTPAMPVVLPRVPFPEPVIHVAIEAKVKGEEDKISMGLTKLREEDPTFHWEYNPDVRQTWIRGLGERHLEVILGRLSRKFGVHANVIKPKIPYRETIKGRAEGEGKHKKQTGGRGQFGDCWIRMMPLPRGSGYVFDDQIVGGAIPNKFIPAVDRGIQEAAQRGVLSGCPMVDFKVELFDGKYHDVDSNEMSFKLAGRLAFRNVAPNCRPVLLEPLQDVEVLTPEEYLGAVMGDLSSRRGQILGSEPDGRVIKLKAIVPEAELYKYATQLHSITHGRATYRAQFRIYAEVPPDIAAKIAEEYKKEHKEAEEE